MAVVSTRYDQVGRPWEQTEPEWRTTANVGYYEAEPWSTPDSPRSTFAYPIYSNHSYVTGAGEGCRAGANTEVSYRTGAGTEWARSASTVCGLEQRSWDRDVKFTKVITDVRGNPLTSRDPAGGTTTFAYNLRDQVTSVTDAAGAQSTYTFTDWGIYGPSATVDPDKGSNSYTYDPHGRVATTTDARGVTLTYAYDLANRPTTITQGAGTVSSFTYDFAGAFGRLRQAQHTNLTTGGTQAGVVTQTYGYNNRGEVTGITYDIPGMPGGAKTINYSYYEGGQPFRTLYPNGTEIETGYTREGQPFWIGLTDPTSPHLS